MTWENMESWKIVIIKDYTGKLAYSFFFFLSVHETEGEPGSSGNAIYSLKKSHTLKICRFFDAQ